jgi:flavin-dependent dehydrogenase
MRFCRLRRQRAGWRVLLDDGGHWLTIDAAIVVDATGGAARVARQLGVRTVHADSMVAVSFIAQRARSAPGDPSLTLFESCPAGWWHVHDAGGEARRFMLLTDADLVPRGERDMWSLLHQTLQEAPASLLRMIESEHTSVPEVVACGNRVLRNVCGEGWLALGDAALTCDPLSASGVDLALTSAELAQATIDGAGAGVSSSWISYNAAAQSTFTLASATRAAFCHQERRWPDAPFWARRQKPPLAQKDRAAADENVNAVEMTA